MELVQNIFTALVNFLLGLFIWRIIIPRMILAIAEQYIVAMKRSTGAHF